MADLLDFDHIYGDQIGMAINPTSLNFAHGSYISSMTIDQVTQMSMEHFKEKEVPTLNTDHKDQYLIRDLSNGRIYVLLPDCVLKFNVQNLYEITGQEFKSAISTGGESIDAQVWNTKVPVYSYGATANSFSMTLKIPPVKMLFRHTSGRSGSGELTVPITMPPLLYKVSATHAGVLQGASVQVILDDTTDNLKTGHLYFPNVFASHQLCLGTIRRTTEASFKNDYEVTMAAFQVWTNSLFNNDLLSRGSTTPDFEMIEGEQLDPVILKSGISCDIFKKVLSRLKKPEGWKTIKWRPAEEVI